MGQYKGNLTNLLHETENQAAELVGGSGFLVAMTHFLFICQIYTFFFFSSPPILKHSNFSLAKENASLNGLVLVIFILCV